MALINGYHHVTLSVDGTQEDYDYHTRTLGMKSVKRTVLFDGTIPVYHLYYGNAAGDPSTIVTTFPFRKPGVFGRRGTNQSKIIQLSIPVGASDFWVNRLGAAGIAANKAERFGLARVALHHPCGIPYELVESPADPRAPITSDGISAEHGIKGIHGAAIAVFDRTAMDDFLTIGIGMQKEADDASGLMFSVPADKSIGNMVEVLVDTSSPQGTWTLAGGTIHHLALNTVTEENQMVLKARIEGMGFTDVSDQKDRNYFKSCYVRSPGGALFEIAWSVPQGWTVDEPAGQTGTTLVFPPWFADRKAEMVAGLEDCSW